MSDEETPGDLRTPPLNLPVGSVRALLTLSVLSTVWWQILQGEALTEELRDTMLLVLGYYFGVRSVKRPAAEAFAAEADREENPRDPLYLPRGAIRLLILVGFGAVAWKLHERGQLFPSPPPILILAGTFLAGAIVKGSAVWIGKHLTTRIQNLAGHLVALATLSVVFAFCGLEVAGWHAKAPPWLTPTFLGVIGFYLGKR